MVSYIRLNTFFEVLMKQTNHQAYSIDNASLLFLSLIQKNHTNSFRFSMTLTETICPDTLQLAVDRTYRRFPTIIAGFRPGFFHYLQVPAKEPPQVQPDPGVLHTMEKQELHNCAFRVLYRENVVAIEAFHALTDGYGAIACFTTMIAEYLRLKHGIHIPVEKTLMDLTDMPTPDEVTDAYEQHETGTPLLVPSRYSYQLPGVSPSVRGVKIYNAKMDTASLLDASHHYGVSMTSLLSGVMAKSIMEIQAETNLSKEQKPVRIMVPVDLRKMFPSRTLRNFVLYALPTMEPQEIDQPISELLKSFAQQIRKQAEYSRMASIMAYNVRTQRAWYFRAIPWFLKSLFLRIGYRFFGGSNSSVTVTNLGNVQLPKEMTAYVQNIDVALTPRVRSPYGCAVLSYNGIVNITISRFNPDSKLENRFFGNLHAVMQKDARP